MKTQKQNFTNLNNSKVVNRIFKNVLGIMVLASLASCIDDNNEVAQTQPDGEALAARFLDNRVDALQEFTLDAASGGVITGTQGTQVTFQPNSFGINGSPVTGNVTVELIEIYDKASMLLKNKSTLGMRDNGDKEALKSAGEFFINAKQGSNELELLAMANVNSRPVDFADLDGGMQIFRGGPDEDCDGIDDDCDWVEADEDGNGEQDDAQIRDAQGADGAFATYNYDIGDFGWTNLDRWYNYAGAKTEIFIDVPNEFNQDNCAVYLSYDGEPTALARMDVYNTELEMFTEHYGLIPVGLEVHIIMVAEIDGQLNYAIQGTTIVDDHIEVISSLSPITQAALETLINDLP
ncbi:MAG: hypothetical protein HKP59_12030 [Lutibacter sp.]|uniref:hypothetical protein n=1 Tax=Lutibacter sp. TaxID=1925666 RepID=UPI00180F72A1|nr:hypothetical protein [Lutibacter sp.]MBT8318341.1 hypothetical protein [Lutibacter sp.]NNJ59199.1 hypothetical protein [Lutibacter sp.]